MSGSSLANESSILNSFRPLTGIMIFNMNVDDMVRHLLKESFRPLTGIMIFN